MNKIIFCFCSFALRHFGFCRHSDDQSLALFVYRTITWWCTIMLEIPSLQGCDFYINHLHAKMLWRFFFFFFFKILYDVLILIVCRQLKLLSQKLGWVGLWGFLWWASSAKRKDHLDGAVFDIAQILAYLVHNMSRSQVYLGFGHFGWLACFFWSIIFWRAYG